MFNGSDMSHPLTCLRNNAAAISVAAIVILFGTVLDSLGAIAFGLELDWFSSLPIYLGMFWLTLSLLFGMLRDRASSDVSILRISTWQSSFSRHVPVSRILNYLCVALLLSPFMSTFVSLKRSIPFWRPFGWDRAFFNLDRVLHGGHSPWELMDAVFPWPEFTIFIDQVYYLWFPVVILTVTWFAWTPASQIRSRFFVTYFVSWSLLGIGLATATSSAGPCYYRYVVPGPDPYSGLMEHLRLTSQAHGLTALRVQDYLWTGYLTNEYPIEGIAAMPSMHVAMAVLFSFAGFQIHRFLGYAYLSFLGLILVGSVHLGWHYAVDGYVSVLLVAGIWYLTGRFHGTNESEHANRGQI